MASLSRHGFFFNRLVRTKTGSKNDIYWNPDKAEVDLERMEGFDAVVHLAGENIAAQRWTSAQKARIRDSRIVGTQLLAESLGKLRQPPKVMVCASATGFYGNRGNESIFDNSPPGTGFLPDLCREWEAAAAAGLPEGIRLVHLRFGMVLAREGGALAKMMPLFKKRLGGTLGGGQQWWSWLSIDDAAGIIRHALETDGLSGPVNAVSPYPVTNLGFTKTLAGILGRLAIFPVPAFALRLALGEMADALLLASVKATPRALLRSGYQFEYPDLGTALRHLLSSKLFGRTF